ncbi:APC family permease [Rhodococcus wratislaviensis]|uniref:APC family permease n=1 Tax=Rhodococcus wratislaviensis TaxID=44752 RepID=UPI00364B544D
MSVHDSATAQDESIDGDSSPRLRGDLTTLQLLLSVLAYNAPLGVVVGFSPVIIGYGNGLGAPGAYLVAMLIMSAFAVGFLQMAKCVKNPGGFYSYVALGLGRPAGLGASFLALACYYALLLTFYAYMGFAVQGLVSSVFNGPEVQWWVWSLAALALTAALGYFRLDLSAKILTVTLLIEIAAVVIYDLCVVIRSGESGLSARSFTFDSLTSGNIGLALLFATMCLIGFESTVVFRDELRNPERSIPRATYGFLALVATLFGVTVWATIEALGEANAVAATAADPAGAFLGTVQTFVGTAGVDIIQVLLVSSIFAGMLATHNVFSRYVFNLAADGVLPKSVARVHPRHGSPHRGSLFTTLISLAGVIVLIAIGSDPALLYAQLSGGFGYSVIMLLLFTSVAMAVFMFRQAPAGSTVFHRFVCPALACASFVVVLWLATANIDVLITAGDWVVGGMLLFFYGVVALGIALAMWFKKNKKTTYQRIGRQ